MIVVCQTLRALFLYTIVGILTVINLRPIQTLFDLIFIIIEFYIWDTRKRTKKILNIYKYRKNSILVICCELTIFTKSTGSLK